MMVEMMMMINCTRRVCRLENRAGMASVDAVGLIGSERETKPVRRGSFDDYLS